MTGFTARVYFFRFCNAFNPIFPVYVAMFVDRGLNPTQVSIALAAWSATTFLCQAPAGSLADRFSRRGMLALGQVAFAGCFAVWWAFPNFWGILIGLVLWGLKSASTNGVFEALLYDELKQRGQADRYLQILGRARSMDAFAFLGAAGASAALAGFGYGPLVAVSMASSILGVFAALALPKAPPAISGETIGHFQRIGDGLRLVAARRDVAAVILFAGLVWALGPGLQEFWPVFGQGVGLSLSTISLIVGVQFIIEAAANLAAHRLRGGRTAWLYGLFVLSGLMLVAAALWCQAPAMALLVAYSGVMRLLDAIFEGRLQSLIPSERRATIGAVKGLVVQAGMMSLFAGIGWAAHVSSYNTAFLACGIAVTLIGLAWLAGSAFRRPGPTQT